MGGGGNVMFFCFFSKVVNPPPPSHNNPKGLGWEEDKLNCEDEGRLEDAEIEHVSQRAEMRGLNQVRRPLRYR